MKKIMLVAFFGTLMSTLACNNNSSKNAEYRAQHNSADSNSTHVLTIHFVINFFIRN